MASPLRRRPVPAVLTAVLAATALAGAWARRDYRAWRALGPGGLPSTPRGWLTTTRLRLRKAAPLDVTGYGEHKPTTPLLSGLPRRHGPRPRIGPWPIPHRPVDQRISTAMHTALDAAFADLVSAHPAFLTTRRSVLEGHCDAMALRDHATAPVDLRTTQGEIAHVHPGDGSLHMILAASDARAVIEGAWGERHPLAGVVPQLPSTYLLVYPPRDEEELKIVTGILEAAVRNAAPVER
ncbi:luciferase domain-containing protein [Streptomyces cinereospinus]|uniref:Luciferase domain-containing protein n=1 Tax=Streptomyces cinereospinus TaxID=285561 RepID=A0ABV5N8H7_9ACTN